MLELPPSEPGLAMHPHCSFRYATPDDVERAAAALEHVHVGDEPLFKSIQPAGTTMSVELQPLRRQGPVHLRNGESAPSDDIALADIGVAVEERLGGGNTAYHIPEGIWLAYGPGVAPDPSRDRFSVLEAKPRILEMLGI